MNLQHKYILTFMANLVFLLINGQNFVNVAESLNIFHSLSSTDNWGSGVSFYDVDNDGWDDITFVQEFDSIIFYKNNQGVFSKVSTGIYNDGETKQVLWVDFNNNGLSDLFITTRNGTYKLYKNNGDFQFQDISQQAGFSGLNSNNYGVSFADYDKDGYLDFYICRYYGNGDTSDLSKINNLYRNNGDGTFTNVTLQAGVGDGIQPSFIGVWLDFNNDTWPDLYVINDRSQWGNSLYKNNGDGTFTEISTSAGAHLFGQDPMSGTVGDFNNNGFLDIYMSNTGITGKEGMLLVNNQDETFTESAQAYGVDIDEWSWGAAWVDFDNDTYKDLYVTTARPNTFQPDLRSRFYINQAGNSFIDAPTFFDNDMVAGSYAVAAGDFDNNGYYDLAVLNGKGDNSYLFKNTGGDNNYIKISLEGTISNKMAIGSWIHVYVNNNEYVHYTMCGENYMSQNSQHHIFGLADFEEVDSILVIYPSGILDKYFNFPVNQNYYLVEGETTLTSINIIGNTKLCEGDSVILDAGDFQSYLWNTGDTGKHLTVYESGNFYVEVIDSNNNLFNSDTVQIEVLQNLQFDIQINQPSCFNDSDGSILVHVFPAFQDFTIVWNDTINTTSLYQLSAGIYTLVYSDNYNCTFEQEYTLENPEELNVQTNLVLNEDENILNVLVNGGAPPYNIYLDSSLIDPPIYNLESGNHLLSVFDANNCSYFDTIEIQSNVNITQLFNEDLNHYIEIYPNPILENNILNININLIYKKIIIQIYDIYGGEVFSKIYLNKNIVKNIYLNGLSKGAYFVKLKIDNNEKVFKIIK